MELKMRINKTISSAENLGIYDVSDEGKVRFVIEGASAGNEIVVRGRIKGASSFEILKQLVGSANEVINVFTYEELEVECVSFDSSSGIVKIIASSFNDAGGSAIESIGVPSGDTLTDIETLNFTSSNGSVTITGNNTTKTIDLTSTGSSAAYVPADPTDWSPQPSSISNALDQLADRIDNIEDDIGQPNGIATLDGTGKVPASQLPSYVDDVIEVVNFAALPATGEIGKIYVTIDNNKTYRWTGSIYVEISSSPENVAINFNSTSNWTSVADEFVLSIPASTHLRGLNPQVQIYEIEGSDFANVIVYTAINSSGDIIVAVPQSPDTRFAGKAIIS